MTFPLPSTRDSQTASLLGPELFEKVRNAKLLVVGAGGIGCELREFWNGHMDIQGELS